MSQSQPLSQETFAALLGASADPVQAGVHLRELAESAETSGPQLLAWMSERSVSLGEADPAVLGGLLRLIHLSTLRAGPEEIAGLSPPVLRQVATSLPEATPNRHLLLQLLAMIRTEEALRILVDLLDACPPRDWMEAGQVLSPLMQHDDWPVEALFPDVLETLSQPALAAPVLDLANYLVRSGRVRRHPAADRVAVLNHLLGEISGRLSQFEEDPHALGDDVETVQRRLGESVALAVSLCDAVGLIGDESSVGKLSQTVELRHRRVQCEAAGALARFGEQAGKQRLLELTADPAARLRAIHYADELGLGDQVDEQRRSEVATAEAEMAMWLTQPQQMGVPPTGVEVVASRRLMWPSFTEPVDVHLVRFEYNFGDRRYSNIGVTGPVTFAFSADVAELPTDDIFAIYAGWHAEHPDIFTVPADQFNAAQRRLVEPLTEHLDRAGFEDLRPQLLGFFLDEHAAVFRAVRDGTECVVVTDGLETMEQTVAGRLRPLGPEDLFNLYKGRKMLRTFNP